MRMDIGFGFVIIPTAQNLTYPVLMDELPAPEVLAYSLKLDDAILNEAIQATFNNKSTVYQDAHPLFTDSFMKEGGRNMQWKRFLKKIKQDEDLDFEDVVNLISSRLRLIYETLNTDKQ